MISPSSFPQLLLTVTAGNIFAMTGYHLKERIAVGHKAFFANKKIFQSNLISKTVKLKLYFSVIIPIVTYACETWILKETITHRLMVF
jgi:hypothetical protein